VRRGERLGGERKVGRGDRGEEGREVLHVYEIRATYRLKDH
jgi:hypothetical protein